MSILKVAEIVDRQQAFAAGFGINARKVHGLSEEEYETICKIASVIMEKTMVKAAQMAQHPQAPITPVPTPAPDQSPEAQPPTTVVPLAPGQEADVKRKEFVKSRATKDQEAANKAAIMWPKKTTQVVPPAPPAFNPPEVPGLKPGESAFAVSKPQDATKKVAPVPKTTNNPATGYPYGYRPAALPPVLGVAGVAAREALNPATGYPYGYRPAARRSDPTSPGSLSPGFYKWMKEKGLL